ncbi:unnamed protein product, partial [Closterium sp. NIES-54]
MGIPTAPHFSPFSHSLAPPTSPPLFSTTSSSRHSPARQPTPAADAAVVAAGLPELPRVGLKNEIRYEYGDARDSALLRPRGRQLPRSQPHLRVRVLCPWGWCACGRGAMRACVLRCSSRLSTPRLSHRLPYFPALTPSPRSLPLSQLRALSVRAAGHRERRPRRRAGAGRKALSLLSQLPLPLHPLPHPSPLSHPIPPSPPHPLSFLSCGRYQTGVLATDNGAPGGVLGLGTGPLSPLSQLAESGVVPRAGFALCLEGDDASAAGGGSHLLLGTTDAGPASGSTRVYKNSL